MDSAGRQLKLNTTGAWTLVTTIWNNTLPTASLFSVGTNSETNQSSDTLLAYCFTPIQGYSKFGKYVGNGNADGPFVYTGFRPSWVLIKAYEDGESWTISDDVRDGYNEDNATIRTANTAAQAATYMNILSNGFKIINTNTESGASGYNYLYAAFARSPFVNSEGVPTNAR